MTDLERNRHRATKALRAIAQHDRQWGAPRLTDQLLEQAVYDIAQYTLALALDRLAKAGCEASAERLAPAILAHQRDTSPFPP